MQLCLTATPDYLTQALRLTAHLAHAAYRVGSGGELLCRTLPATLRGGQLVLQCDCAFPAGAAERLAQDVLQVCIDRHFAGVVLDCTAELPCVHALISALAPLCLRYERQLYLPEHCAGTAESAKVLICTAISGGTLRQWLEEATAQYGAARIALDLQRLMMDFPLPCPGGEGIALNAQQLQTLQSGHSSYYCSELCTHYFTYRRGSATRFVLYDDAGTLRRKMEIAEALGITEAFVMWPEVDDILMQLFTDAKKEGEP